MHIFLVEEELSSCVEFPILFPFSIKKAREKVGSKSCLQPRSQRGPRRATIKRRDVRRQLMASRNQHLRTFILSVITESC